MLHIVHYIPTRWSQMPDVDVASAESRYLFAVVMFITRVLLKKGPKSKNVMVLMESVVSGHKYIKIRERLADKLELVRFDPYIQMDSVYRERKKIRSI